MDYKQAGVDLQQADKIVDFVKNLQAGIGGFSGRYNVSGLELLSSTDGVGTKILVAKELNDYSTIGIDLVAMSVNDISASGGRPLFFLDYIACGKINKNIEHVITGVLTGCGQASCTLLGGETAEMPDMYAEDDMDLSGFAVGLAIKSEYWCACDGDVILGLPSNGIHSNGLSLARKVVPKRDWEQLLTPTIIYTPVMTELSRSGLIMAGAHITGGGLYSNIKRALGQNLEPRLNWDWGIPDIFNIIQKKVSEQEMRRVFNMGIGMAIVVSRDDIDKVKEVAKDAIIIGTVCYEPKN